MSKYDQHCCKPLPCKRQVKYKKPCGRWWRAALFHWSVWLVPRQCHLTGQTTRGGGRNVCRQGGRTILEHWVTCSRTCRIVREVLWIELQDCSAFLLLPCIPGKFIGYIRKVGWLRHRVDVCANEFFLFGNFREGAKELTDKAVGNWLKLAHVAWLLLLLIKVKPYCVLTV